MDSLLIEAVWRAVIAHTSLCSSCQTLVRSNAVVVAECEGSEGVSQSGPGGVEEMQEGGRRVRLEWGAYITV
ncbi:hypothetical protein FHG87_008664 [Trinorchestia longiramus]|nr:hypothetical protein FHG87_008664 [Trinorchestia longiramus]